MRRLLLLIFVLTTLSVLLCIIITKDKQQSANRPNSSNGTSANNSLNTTELASKVLPAVVTIEVSDTAQGSGVIIDSDGSVLTCYHVLAGGKQVIVKMADGGYFPIKDFGIIDRRLDLAIAQISGRNLPYLRLGDSSALRPGDKILTIGSPLGLESSVSEGIISALRKVEDFPEELKQELLASGRKQENKLIQFTAPVSPGNSGGPLVNTKGEIVGIVVAGIPAADNVYFAIPINDVKPLLADKNHVMLKIGETDSTEITSGTYSPPTQGSFVTVHTPKGFGVNLREMPSNQSARIAGREMVLEGESILVLQCSGDWLLVET